jgi:hypothetical protein
MALKRSWVYQRAIGMGEPLMELRRHVSRRSISKDIGVTTRSKNLQASSVLQPRAMQQSDFRDMHP